MQVLTKVVDNSLSWVTASEKQQKPWGTNKFAKCAQSVFNHSKFLVAGEGELVKPSWASLKSPSTVCHWFKDTYQRGSILLKGEKPWEGPHGFQRARIIATRIAMVIIGALALSASCYGLSLGLQQLGSALITKAPSIISPYSQASVEFIGKALVEIGIAVNTFAGCLFAMISDPTLMVLKGAKHGIPMVAGLAVRAYSHVEANVYQPGKQFLLGNLPCLKESLARVNQAENVVFDQVNRFWA